MTAVIRHFRVDGADGGPLSGETLIVKANIAVAGQPWDGASPAMAGVVADAHAPAVARALAAGATVVGHANMHELAFGITSDNAAFGAVESPHGGMAGGSSGGTAAAIADGTATMGLGTDTGGSGRIPASFCGCVGLRPTTGRIPTGGVLTLSETVDAVAPMGRDVAAVARLDAVLSGEDGWEAVPLDGLRLGRLAAPFWADLDPDVEAAAEAALDRLRARGARVEDRDAPDLMPATAAVAVPLVIADARRWWAPFLRERLGLDIQAFASRIASPDVAGVFAGIAADATDDDALARMRGAGVDRVRAALRGAMDGLDLLVHPATPVPAPDLHATEVVVRGRTRQLFPDLTSRCLVASLGPCPALSLPMPIAGRPVGLELFGHPGGDRRLLAIAASVEDALNGSPA